MGKRLLLLMILVGTSLMGWAQNDKFSVTTQMFLNELKGELTFERDTKSEKQLGLRPVEHAMKRKGKNANRLYAAPDTIDGKAYIAAYLRLNDTTSRSELEAKGVIIQEEFANGLVTSLIPVDQINAVAGLSNVKRINVSPLKKVMTRTARQATNVDDVLTLSADAQAEGLESAYDGSGVVLGVIDTGIDFAHIAFKDASGNSRIKRAYVYNGSRATEYTSITSSTLTDDSSEDHGTHTSTTAGGSSVKVNGTTVTVTDDHANANYGGMAPGADLYLAGINSLSSTYLDNAVKKMCDYADSNNQPLVVSNSWGSQMGPHDGTGDEADVYNSLFGDSHPNRIALFASSNDGGKSKDGEGGGYHVSGTASSSSPLGTIVRCDYYTDTDGGYFYYGPIANAWCRSTSVSSMACKIYVLDASTGAVKTSVTVTPSTSGATVSGLSSYFTGTLYAYKDYISSDKTQIMLYASELTSRGTSQTTRNGETYYKSNYTLAVEFYPTSGSATIDVWGGNFCYFTSHLTTSGHTWKAGSDDMCVSDESMMPSVISVGAYVSANTWKDYKGTSHDMSDEYTLGDIAPFSSYATAAESPDGQQYPWITAPGARLAAGVNHNHTASVDDYSYYGSNFNTDLVVNSSSYPYAMMEGTSMATPTAAGIVALWLQAAKEVGKELTVSDVKEIMRVTAINDSYTTSGANASHFGNGKIDALAGIKYILGATAGPAIIASPKSVALRAKSGGQASQTINVKGRQLSGNITLTLNDPSGVFAIDKTTIAAAQTETGADINVTFSPAKEGNYAATVTIAGAGADDVTLNISGVCMDGGTATDAWLDIAKYATIDEAGWNTSYVNNLYQYTEHADDEVAWLTLPVYGAWSAVYYTPAAQKWMETNVNTTSNKYAGTSWSSSNELLGSAAYFTSASARAMGYNARSNYTQESFTFYVSNTTAVKLLGLGQSRTNSSYPATLDIYECTVNADGTLTAGTTAVKSYSNSATSGTFVLSATDLDAEKVYKVVAATYRSLICEIGFQTPLTVEKTPEVSATPTSISVEAPVGSSAVETLAVTGKNLEGSIALTLSDEAGVFAIDKNSLETGGSINVTFTPKAAQTYQASLTIESEGAESVSVSLEGTGLQPFIMADPEELSFAEIEAESTETLTVNVVGENLCEAVTATLSDANGVFSLDATSLSKDEVMTEEGKQLAVTFAPQAAGTYTGSVTLTSPNAESVVISLSATAKRKTPDYYDATISSVGLSTMYLDFPVEIPYDAYDPDLLGVYIIYDMSDRSELKLARLNTTIPANTGVIIQGNSGTYRFPKATGNVSELKRNNYLQGVVETTPVSTIKAAQPSQGTIYTLGKGTDSYIGFYKYSGKNINANRCYLFIDNAAAANGFSLDFDDMATAIDQLRAGEEQGEWVTLQGIRLNGKPAQRGIYIHNGKTVNIK